MYAGQHWTWQTHMAISSSMVTITRFLAILDIPRLIVRQQATQMSCKEFRHSARHVGTWQHTLVRWSSNQSVKVQSSPIPNSRDFHRIHGLRSTYRSWLMKLKSNPCQQIRIHDCQPDWRVLDQLRGTHLRVKERKRKSEETQIKVHNLKQFQA
jgi:hypothetical protein